MARRAKLYSLAPVKDMVKRGWIEAADTIEALRAGADVRIRAFETMQRVLNDRVTDAFARRGRQLLETLRSQADRDGLTGLFTRGYLDRRVARDYEEARASIRTFCVALIDLDRFGLINKTRGWPTL